MEVTQIAYPDGSHLNVTGFCALVAMGRAIAREAMNRLNAGKTKGWSVKARLVGED